jgi:UDP-N-acetylmuramyl pentapeptide phosphotransferase/UDP-N-acetylglucosamine-1-phosphate transferase
VLKIRKPVATAFLIALALSVALAVLWPYTVQESPWALTFIVFVFFPFAWFFVWLITNAITWWQGLKGE